MKRKSKMLQMMVLLAVLAFGVCGCGDGEKNGADNAPAPAQIGEDISSPSSAADPVKEDVATADGFYFSADGVQFTVDEDMDEVAPKLGESKSLFEAPSCAGEGISYIYNYGSYQVETYPADGINKIGNIILKDDMVSTKEGIDLSMTKSDVIAAYGDGYEAFGNQITYQKGGCKLNFVFDGENIVSIEYVSAVLG